jgi:hypothetical protein
LGAGEEGLGVGQEEQGAGEDEEGVEADEAAGSLDLEEPVGGCREGETDDVAPDDEEDGGAAEAVERGDDARLVALGDGGVIVSRDALAGIRAGEGGQRRCVLGASFGG